ncbi:MAG: sigma-54 dependent transcriptional regulator [Acidobacteria bacterium]|nr:sigma-54 dependent transcriptional regulator [Acidobacteriota bacterium]MDA1233227.1 sigma-54 dependent transcriptional regulator [Acidobacteriota bacterium]
MPETPPYTTAIRALILIIDDEESIRESLEALLTLERFAVETAPDATSGLALLGRKAYDLILLDLMLPDRSGLEVLEEVRQYDSETPIVMLTAYGTVETAVKAIRLGADDFFTKPWNNAKLVLGIEQTIARRRLESENRRLRSELQERYSFDNIVGKSEPMQRVFSLVEQVAPSRSTVLVTGESGTGKELIAKAIHARSPRSGKPFVPVNSGSISLDLMESALFGHVKGSFTGASYNRKGFFEAAHEGTIFLDEIGTLGLETQAKLLRVIQELEFTPVGSSVPVNVDVRIIAATNENIAEMVAEGTFREDLYYRLNVIEIHLPPLRDRRSDIPLLVRHFFDRFCRENDYYLDSERRSTLDFDQDAMRMLMDHAWPGNVRELENAVERAVVLAKDPVVPVEMLPKNVLERHGMSPRNLPLDFKPAAGASLPEQVEEFEKRLIVDELQKAGWNQTETARRLKVALSTLNQKIQRLGLDVKALKAADG